MTKTKMTLRDLQQLRSLKKEINELEDQIKRINSKRNQYVTDCANDYRTGYPMPITLRGYSVADYAKADEKEAILRKREETLRTKVISAMEFISTVDDSQIRRALTLRFIEGKEWLVVSRKIYGSSNKSTSKNAVDRYFAKF